MKVAVITGMLLATTVLNPVAASSGGPSERRPGPPPAAFEACSGKTAGDACTVKFREQEIAGTCETFPDDDRLACRPAGFPQRPPDRAEPP